MVTPAGLALNSNGTQEIYNPSFDVTPADLITAIVTEKGVAIRQDGEAVFDLRGIV